MRTHFFFQRGFPVVSARARRRPSPPSCLVKRHAAASCQVRVRSASVSRANPLRTRTLHGSGGGGGALEKERAQSGARTFHNEGLLSDALLLLLLLLLCSAGARRTTPSFSSHARAPSLHAKCVYAAEKWTATLCLHALRTKRRRRHAL